MPVNERIFVTGGSGFVGRNLIARLLREKKPIEIRALARSESSKQAVLKAGATSVVEGDLDSIDVLAKGMEGCDTVYHIAAFVSQNGTLEEFRKGNVTGTSNVVQACKKAGVQVLVHCSTEATLVQPLGNPLVNAGELSLLYSSNCVSVKRFTSPAYTPIR